MALSTIQNNSFADTAVHGYRNLVINGAMQVAQRGTSFTNPVQNTYLLDRWFSGSNLINLTVTQQSSVTVNGTISKTMRFDFTGSSSFDFYQAFEDYEYLSGKTVTLSFWYRTNVSGVVIRQYATTTHDTLTDSSGSWTYHTITFTFGTLQSNPRSANGATIGFWDNSTGNIVSGSYFEITQVQLELGSEATPFEHRPYGDELQRCQRYYYQLGPYTNQYEVIFMPTWATSTTTQQLAFNFPVKMRAAPTITHNGVSEFRVNDNLQHDEVCNSILFSQIRPERSMATFGKASANLNVGYSGYINTNNYTSATIYIDAEL